MATAWHKLKLNHWFGKNLFNFMLVVLSLNLILFGLGRPWHNVKTRGYSEILWPITDLLYSQLLLGELLKQRPPTTIQFFIASDQSSVEFMIVVSGKLSWDSLFPQFQTKQATGSERWQISTKWLKKDLQKLMKMRRTELLIQQHLKTHKNDAVWVECF